MTSDNTSAANGLLRGFYGGTFDPIHQGHLQSALFVVQYCQLHQLELLPCHLPPHRASPSSSLHRAAMVRLAIAPYPQLQLNLLELQRDTPSYTVDSLSALQQQYPHDTLCFVIGMDSLSYFKRWHRWQDILATCHLLVLQRPGFSADDGDAPALLHCFGADTMADLQHGRAGKILLLPNPPIDVSASAIRAGTVTPALQICAVQHYIEQHQLYQR
jgi:nicotinate-nucleotide adenylyltransferase